ncbi:hypothetical protein LTR37_001507 [Vermiconidia calcicola]|uniref:Uncharacterized protein n=1 Tax=Vermiconidia calcicola TaxID=1690605 RepID=A0ACC3NV99_9PEZI|nr:hypothetical protein LTR37_001507 [Vermiconidia calcicola]
MAQSSDSPSRKRRCSIEEIPAPKRAKCLRELDGGIFPEGDDEEDASSKTTADFSDIDLVKLFIFGAEFNLPELSNDAISMLAFQNDQHGRTTTKGAINAIYDIKKHSSRLRHFVEHEALSRLNAQTSTRITSFFPPEFLTKILKRVTVKEGHPGHDSYSKMWSWACPEGHKHVDKAARSECRKRLKRMVPIPDAQRLRHHKYRQPVHIYIGPERARFMVHEGLICDSSYFRAAFQGRLAESKTKFLELPPETVKDFTLFVHWLYTGDIRCLTWEEQQQYQDYRSLLSRGCLTDLDSSEQTQAFTLTTADTKRATAGGQSKTPPASPSSRDGLADLSLLRSEKLKDCGHVLDPVTTYATMDSAEVLPNDTHCKDNSSHESSNEERECFTTIAQRAQDDFVSLYIFADRRDIPGLRNTIINFLARTRENGWPILSTTQCIKFAYSALPPDSALCKYLAAEAAWLWDQNFGDTNDIEDLPAEFSARVMRIMLWRTNSTEAAMAGKASRPKPWRRNDLCYAHDHESEDAKIVCREGNEGLLCGHSPPRHTYSLQSAQGSVLPRTPSPELLRVETYGLNMKKT